MNTQQKQVYGIEWLATEVLSPSEMNPRKVFAEADIAELAESVRAQGVLQPLLVRAVGGWGYEIVAGERRWRAARTAGLEMVPCVVRVLSDREVLELQVTENLQRVDLSLQEEVACFQALLDLRDDAGVAVYSSAAEVGRRVGRSAEFVRGRVALAGAPAALAAVGAGEMDLFVAAAIARLPREKDREAAASEVVGRGLWGQQATDWIEHRFERSLVGVPWDLADGSLVRGRCCEGCPMRRGDVCGDVGCFDEHVMSEYERWAAAVAGEGREVLGFDENAEMVNGDRWAWNSGVVGLDAEPEERLLRLSCRAGKVPSWRTLIEGRGVPLLVGRRGDFSEIEGVMVALAMVAAKENGHDIFAGGNEGRKEQAERVRQEGLERARVRGDARAAIVERVRAVSVGGWDDAARGQLVAHATAALMARSDMEVLEILRVADVVENSNKDVWLLAARVLVVWYLCGGDETRAADIESWGVSL